MIHPDPSRAAPAVAPERPAEATPAPPAATSAETLRRRFRASLGAGRLHPLYVALRHHAGDERVAVRAVGPIGAARPAPSGARSEPAPAVGC